MGSGGDVGDDLAHVISAADAVTVGELGGQVLRRTPEMIEKITGVVQYGLVDPKIATTYPLEQAGKALAHVEQGHARKIVLKVTAVQD